MAIVKFILVLKLELSTPQRNHLQSLVHALFFAQGARMLLEFRMLESDQSMTINEDLVIRGLDSIKTISLVVALEKEFEIVFEDEELLIRHFSTIEKIVAQVKGKLEA